MDLTIYTYGHIDATYYVLNGIAMIMNSRFADMMINAMVFVSASYWCLRAAYASSSGNAKYYLIRIFGMICIVNALLVPKATISIKDHISKKRDHVDNLPYGFALPVCLLENFGNIITTAFEQAFAGIDNMQYQKYGMVFGANLIREARNWKIQNPEFIFNMHNFIKRCIILDLGMDKYSINDLLKNEDIWPLIKAKSSKFRFVDVRTKEGNDSMSCHDAANLIFKDYFDQENENFIAKYKNTLYGLAGSDSDIYSPRNQQFPRSFFKKNIEMVFGKYFGDSLRAESRLMQYMMVNSLSDLPENYGVSRASMSQESNWKIAGELASYYLPILLSVMKNLVYASFIFIVPLLLLGSGLSRYFGYISIILSMQLWPALNSVLNLFIDLYSAEQMKDLAECGISFANYGLVGNYADKIALVAAGLQTMVPFLAFSIVQGGVSGFIHLANSITAASNNAANIASGDVSTGNRSFDNYSASNSQIDNNNGFKTDYNSSYKTGMQESQNVDGSMSRTFSDGESIIQSGMGVNISGGGARFSLRKGLSDQISKDISNTESSVQSSMKLYREAEYDTMNKVSSLLGQIAKRDSEGVNIDYSNSEEYSDTIGEYISKTQSVRESSGKSWEDSASIAIRGSAGASLFGVGGSIDAHASKGVSYSDAEFIENQNSIEDVKRKDYSKLVRAVSSEQFSSSNNIELSYSDDIRKSYEKQRTYEEQISTQRESLNRFNEAFAKVSSSEGAYEFDMYDELQKKVSEELQISTKDAHDLIEKRDPIISEVWEGVVEKYKWNFIPEEISAEQVIFNNREEDFAREYSAKINKDSGLNLKDEDI